MAEEFHWDPIRWTRNIENPHINQTKLAKTKRKWGRKPHQAPGKVSVGPWKGAEGTEATCGEQQPVCLPDFGHELWLCCTIGSPAVPLQSHGHF